MSRVLVVDDEPGLRQSLGLLLADAGYDVAAEGNGARALERALAESFDLVLCDVRMPEMDGLAFLRAYKGRGGTALVIMMSAYGGEEAALAAMKEGAYDYIPKPFRPDEVVLTLRKAEERERLGHTIATLRAQLDSSPAVRALIAESQPMRQALDMVARVAGHPTTVLITGERGTGKEVIAQAIHRASPRAAGPFVAVNCAAIPDTLLESELFGYVKGAFTGAAGDRPGLFEQADGGTLLLDEIGELPLALQAKLLRVLQENEIRRVGDQKTRRVDVRLLAATAKDLAAEAAAGRFRHDLFDRLNVVAIHLRPLSERRADIAPLAGHFAARLAGRLGRRVALSEAALQWLGEQPWPGNVRSLEHAIERAAVLSEKEVLEPSDFRPNPGLASGVSLTPGASPGLPGTGTLKDAVEGAERQAITAALGAAGGNRREAAKRLGVSLRTLFYKMDRYGID
ncbi:MAG TPA: sigma-54 dependent transcriptional regulator [Gemmatimonadales bacterium]|nr:sigma-54 dependent transcriptional regulator [Gemmatimonadales bacterium]